MQILTVAVDNIILTDVCLSLVSVEAYATGKDDTVDLRTPVSTSARGLKMTSRWIVAVCLLTVMARVSVAQTPRASRPSAATEPPPLPPHALANNSQTDEVIARMLAFQPALPLGPVDVLKGYEVGMALIAQRLNEDLISISQANRANQITREQAEYLIQDRYQVAMMQYDVLSALHDSLEHDLAQAATQPGGVSQADTAVAVQPPSSWQVLTQ